MSGPTNCSSLPGIRAAALLESVQRSVCTWNVSASNVSSIAPSLGRRTGYVVSAVRSLFLEDPTGIVPVAERSFSSRLRFRYTGALCRDRKPLDHAGPQQSRLAGKRHEYRLHREDAGWTAHTCLVLQRRTDSISSRPRRLDRIPMTHERLNNNFGTFMSVAKH